MYLADFREVNQFEFGGANGLSTAVQNRTLWSTFIYQANFEATEVNELETLRVTLNDLVKEIKSFVPSDIDRAADCAKNLRPAVLATCDDYELFLDSQSKTLGTASSIMKDIENHRTTIQQLQSNGLIINVDSVGATSQQLQRMYAYLTDFVSSEQHKLRLEETKTKLELL